MAMPAMILIESPVAPVTRVAVVIAHCGCDGEANGSSDADSDDAPSGDSSYDASGDSSGDSTGGAATNWGVFSYTVFC